MAGSDNANAGPSADSPLLQRTLTVAENRLDSRDLFASAREIVIAHGDERYRLRLTSQNKLILTK
jgi:hemin uptake protein HemP